MPTSSKETHQLFSLLGGFAEELSDVAELTRSLEVSVLQVLDDYTLSSDQLSEIQRFDLLVQTLEALAGAVTSLSDAEAISAADLGAVIGHIKLGDMRTRLEQRLGSPALSARAADCGSVQLF